jgi:acylphosphatase
MVNRAYESYRGAVQGVGFRYTASSLAGRFAIAGYVKNITDGSVEIIAEGEENEVKGFLSAVDSRMGDLVSSREVKWSDATGEFHSFSVRF